ncbi:hypothetical protein [Lysinibacillus fusiformis]
MKKAKKLLLIPFATIAILAVSTLGTPTDALAKPGHPLCGGAGPCIVA